MAASTLRKITARAKKIYKRGGTWKGAIKKAGHEYRSGKMGKVVRMKTRRKKATVKRKRTVKKIRRLHKAEGRAIRSLGTVSHHIAKAKAQLKEQIGWGEAQKFAATKKTSKRKIGKKIAELKSKYRKLC
jgi:hypothetical protein